MGITGKEAIKLIGIKERYVQRLREQAAALAAYTPPHVTNQIMDYDADIVILKRDLRRRLQYLKEKEAMSGIYIDPAILMEIEDIEEYLD